jgi:DHA2 family multidrug resistance protein
MAQASGLINVIRQVGGSFGVAVFGSILTQRAMFHASMYGQQLQPDSPALISTITRLRYFAESAVGSTSLQATRQANALIYSFVGNQAFIQAVDDVFLIAAMTLIISIVPLLFLRGKHRKGSGRVTAAE